MPAKTEKTWPAWPAEMMWDLKKVKPFPDNPKTHPSDQIDLLAELLKLYGPDQPIVVDEKCIILKGHGRRLGALKAGMDKFPVVQRFGLSDADKTAMRISDNQIPLLGGWDRELVQSGLASLRIAGYNINMLGFSQRELVQWAKPEPGPPTEIPEVIRNPFVRDGDCWELGPHRLMCGDSTKKEQVDRVLDGRKATTVTDPPYGVGFAYGEHEDTKAGNAKLVRDVMALAPAAKVWTPGQVNLARELAQYPDAKVLCWHKKFSATHSGLGGASTWEPVLVIGVKDATLPNDYLPFPTDREESPIDENLKLRDEHPCPKPVALFEHLILHLTPDAGVVYEPFNGSGTTLIAAQRTGRHFAGIDIDPAYVELAILRWQAVTGVKATLDGKTFDEVKAARKKRQPVRAGAASSKRKKA